MVKTSREKVPNYQNLNPIDKALERMTNHASLSNKFKKDEHIKRNKGF